MKIEKGRNSTINQQTHDTKALDANTQNQQTKATPRKRHQNTQEKIKLKNPETTIRTNQKPKKRPNSSATHKPTNANQQGDHIVIATVTALTNFFWPFCSCTSPSSPRFPYLQADWPFHCPYNASYRENASVNTCNPLQKRLPK